MLANDADRIKADIATQKALIAQNDKLIEEAERRQSLRRQHGEKLYNRLCRLEEQLAREEAPLRKPTGPCVKETAPDGTVWNL